MIRRITIALDEELFIVVQNRATRNLRSFPKELQYMLECYLGMDVAKAHAMREHLVEQAMLFPGYTETDESAPTSSDESASPVS